MTVLFISLRKPSATPFAPFYAVLYLQSLRTVHSPKIFFHSKQHILSKSLEFREVEKVGKFALLLGSPGLQFPLTPAVTIPGSS